MSILDELWKKKDEILNGIGNFVNNDIIKPVGGFVEHNVVQPQVQSFNRGVRQAQNMGRDFNNGVQEVQKKVIKPIVNDFNTGLDTINRNVVKPIQHYNFNDVPKDLGGIGKSVVDSGYQMVTHPVDTAKSIGEGLAKTGVALTDVATRMPDEAIRQSIAPFQVRGNNLNDYLQNLRQKQLDITGRPLMFEKVFNKDVTKPQDAADFVMSAAEAPAYAYGGGALKQGAESVGGRIIGGVVQGAKTGIPFGVTQTVREMPLSPQDFAGKLAKNEAMMVGGGAVLGGAGATVGEVARPIVRAIRKPIEPAFNGKENVTNIPQNPAETPKVSITNKQVGDSAQGGAGVLKMGDIAGTSPKSLTVGANSSSFDRILPPNDTIVNTQPLSINVVDSAKKTTKDIRDAYTGDKNSQIVRGNQVADTIRKTTTPEDRRSMTWMNEAGGDVNTLKKWANDKNPALDTHRADIQHAVDISNNPSESSRIMKEYYNASGAAGTKLGTIKNTVENYNNRIYQQEKPKFPVTTDAKGGLRVQSRHGKKRTYDTLYDAVVGGKKPATTDAADLLAIHNEEMARVNTNRKLTDVLKQNNLGEWTDGKVPAGYVKLDGIQHTLPFTDKEGNAHIAMKSFAVPDYLASGMKAITEPDYINKINFLRKTGKYQGFVKTVDLSVSMFHHFTFTMQALYQTHGGLDLLQPKFWERLKTQDFNKIEQDFTAHTGMTSNIDANMDVMHALIKGDSVGSKIANIPGIKQVVGLVEKNNEFLFGTMQRQLKVTDYGIKISKWVEKHPQATDAEVTAAKRSFARETNAAYGGLNWESMGVTKSTVGALRKVLLAPDWTISNLELGKMVFKGGPGGAAARAHVASAIIAGTTITEGLNLALTGHTTDKNGPGHEFEVEVRPGVYTSFFRGGIGDMLKLGSRVAESGPISGTSQFLQGKLAPFARTGLGLITNKDFYGRDIASKKDNALTDTGNTLKFLASSGSPVPFGIAAANKLRQSGITDIPSYLLTGTGIARPGSKKELDSVNVTGNAQTIRNFSPEQVQKVRDAGSNSQQIINKIQGTKDINKEKDTIKKSNTGDMKQLSDGTYYQKVGSDYKTFKSEQEARTAISYEDFKMSDKNYQVSGDMVFRRSEDGTPSKITKAKFDYQIGTEALTKYKKNGDVKNWMTTAQGQLNSIDKQLKDPNTDTLDQSKLQNAAQTLKDEIKKYASYGGFTKGKSASGKKGGKARRVSPPSKTSFKNPVRKPSTPQKGVMTVNKPQGSRITGDTLRRI